MIREIGIASDAYTQICEEAIRTYPEEGCGVLFSGEDSHRVDFIKALKNAAEDKENGDCFHIDPLDLFRTEQEAEREGRQIIGFFHTHPDRRAVLSQTDEQYMIPGMLYIIVSLSGGRVTEIRGYKKEKEITEVVLRI